MPANGLTGAKVRAFSFDKIDYHLVTSAPTLNRLLHGLTGFRINEDAPPSAKLSDKHEPVFDAMLALMLLHNRSQTSNYLQRMIGLTLNASGCAKRIVNILNSIHLSLSYDSTQSSLDSLTTDASREVKEEANSHPFHVNYDNLNVFQRVGDQTLSNSDKQTNGVIATLFRGGDFDPPEPIPHRDVALTIEDFTPGPSNREHQRLVFQFYLVDVLRRHCSIPVA
jgi:hypothetical protein